MTKKQLLAKLSFLPFEYNDIKDEVASIFEKDKQTIARLKKEKEVLKASLYIATTNSRPDTHGHWVGKLYEGQKAYDDWSCSECGCFVEESYKPRLGKYCENCGAKMDEKEG